MRNSTMGKELKCPLCCDRTFDTKLSLLQHLTGLLSNLNCPVCDNRWSSITHLIEHLSLDNCQPESSTQSFDVQSSKSHQDVTEIKPYISSNHTLGNEKQTELSPHIANREMIDSIDANNGDKMYTVILGRHVTKSNFQNQELKFVEDNGQSQYVYVEEMDSDLDSGNVVTKQNNDGTISLTTVKDLKTDAGSIMHPSENVLEDNRGEVYSCNSCGVSFSSVIEHIQNYHNDQEVVVEEPVEDGDNEIPMEYDPMMTEGSLNNTNFTSRRMITETGDIVEAPITMKSTVVSDKTHEEKPARGQTRRYVQVEKFCDSHIKDIKPNNDKDEPYHRAVVKEMETADGTKVKMFQCIVCDVCVTTLSDMKLHPCKPLKYPCPQCPVSYENSKSLCAHMKIHKIPKGEQKYNCEICCTVFLTNKSLKLHKRMHDPVKTRPIDPPVKNQDGAEHIVDDTRYLCNICNKMIPIDYRTIHQHSHKSNNKMNCTICNKKFQSEEYLEMHMKAHNMNKIPENKTDKSLPYCCVYCPRQFSRPHEKVKHERIHTGEKPHSCEICGKSFRVSYCLTLHMRTHTGARPYACPHCGKRFKAHSVYNHHLLTHSEKRAYKCPMCPKAFKTSVQLAGHKKCHTKPFSCQHCNRPFASLYAVRVHMETHARQNNLKFTCPLCGARYARAFALKDHVKQAHQLDGDSLDKLQTDGDKDWVVLGEGGDTETIQIEADNIKTSIEEVDIPTSKDNSLITILDINAEEMIVP
ncbi:zinc finger protein 26-like isoform X2 [Plodia interpunctella]|uniref:zinc finger protein 26-like isoform X2 n=1 Tax=Plodia interpunctella TaxID=58824 RepID=UPI0023682018|nr:zinc finger protein 26-like isoform X2 [Plodia interpunctella]